MGQTVLKIKYNLVLVPPALIDIIWPHVNSIVESIVKRSHGEISNDSVKEKLKTDAALMLVAVNEDKIESLIILQVDTFPTGLKVLVVGMAGGEASMFTGEYDEELEKIAKNLNCTEIRAIGARVGWDKFLKKNSAKWSTLSTILVYSMSEN